MQPAYLCPMTGIPPPPQLLTPNLFLSHIRYRGSSLGSDHIPGSEPSPRTARQNMLTISYQIRCKGELMKGMSYRGRVSQKKRWAEAIQSVKGCGKRWFTLKTTILNIKLQRLCKCHHVQFRTSSKDSEKLEKSLCVRNKAEDLCWM